MDWFLEMMDWFLVLFFGLLGAYFGLFMFDNPDGTYNKHTRIIGSVFMFITGSLSAILGIAFSRALFST
ncbi:hypothetical protein LCGC14_0855070 [marine sediment metagenome]|uniref:Uncharacterized protein n=1 Tax=marine sediment metagenome TaxID=412755 RepID=A0A0F9RTS4_9ZZZZ